MLERIKAGLWHVAHFLWEWSWTFSIPVGVILAMTLGSYSPDDPAFSVSTSNRPKICAASGARGGGPSFGRFGLSLGGSFRLLMIAVFAIRSQLRARAAKRIPSASTRRSFPPVVGFLALMLGSTGLEALRLRRFEVVLPAHSGVCSVIRSARRSSTTSGSVSRP